MKDAWAARSGASSTAARSYRAAGGDVAARKRRAIIAAAALLALVATSIVGTIGAAIFILLALTLAALQPSTTSRDLLRFSPLLALPLLAILSTTWSDAPVRTLRAGLQLLLTVVAAIGVSRSLSSRAMVIVLFWGFLVSCLLALPFVPASMQTGYPLAGPFENKNPMGFTAQLLLATALAILFDSRQKSTLRILATASIPMSLFLMFLSQSSGAQTAAAVTLLAFPTLLLFGRVNISFRIGLLFAGLAIVAVVLVLLPDFLAAWADFRTNVLKKDATLTGRTYLWDYAARLIQERPFLGRGYYAFWREGNLDAEGLWRWGGITGRHGFNFHNAFVEMLVDLGWIGEAVLIAACIGVVVASLARQLIRPSVPTAFFLALTAVIYVRSYTETGLIAPFSLVTVIWIATLVYSFEATDFLGQVTQSPTRKISKHSSVSRFGG